MAPKRNLPDSVGPGLATVGQVCQHLNISRAKLYGHMNRGELPFCKIGAARRIRWTDVERFVNEQLVGA